MTISRLLKIFVSLVACALLVISNCNAAHHFSPEFNPFFAFIRAIDPMNSLKIHWNQPLPHPCSYRQIGVHCDQWGSSVFEIRLVNLNLSGILDAESVCKLPNLQVLVLAKNQIQGTIPDSIGNCKSLIHLDMSSNFLTGKLPLALKKLKRLDVSNNPLNVIDLSLLMDSNLPKRYRLEEDTSRVSPQSSPPPNGKKKSEKTRDRIDLMTWILLGVAVTLLLLVLLFYKLKSSRSARNRENTGEPASSSMKIASGRIMDEFKEEEKQFELVFFVEEHERFGLQEILQSGAGLHNKGHSNIHKIQLSYNSIFAVKKLTELQEGFFEEFCQTMKKIGNLKHQNILPLIGYHSTIEEKLVIYRYQANGSLLTLFENYIQGKRDFPWDLRLSIAVGIARGLDYIYRAFDQRNIIPHGNIKLSNILLNENEEPLLSEYGYSKFASQRKQSHIHPYAAPEKSLSEQADAFSFGVILIELLTGKIAATSGLDLLEWVKSKVGEEWTGEIFDKEVGNVEIYGFALLNIALRCVSTLPQERPSMSEVLEKIEEIVDAQSEIFPMSINVIASN